MQARRTKKGQNCPSFEGHSRRKLALRSGRGVYSNVEPRWRMQHKVPYNPRTAHLPASQTKSQPGRFLPQNAQYRCGSHDAKNWLFCTRLLFLLSSRNNHGRQTDCGFPDRCSRKQSSPISIGYVSHFRLSNEPRITSVS